MKAFKDQNPEAIRDLYTDMTARLCKMSLLEEEIIC